MSLHHFQLVTLYFRKTASFGVKMSWLGRQTGIKYSVNFELNQKAQVTVRKQTHYSLIPGSYNGYNISGVKGF